MAKVTAITDSSGAILGTVRSDPIDIGGGRTLRFKPITKEGINYHELDVEDSVLDKSAEELHRELARQLGLDTA